MTPARVPRVLVVDDTEGNRYATSRVLRHAGFEVSEAATGREALVELRNDPDVVVLDVNLLDGDRGIDVLHYLKRHRPRTKVLVLSNAVSDRLRDSYFEAGASAYFDKATEFMRGRDWIAAQLPPAAAANPGAEAP